MTHATVHSATAAMLAAALVVGLVVALAAAAESRLRLTDTSARRMRLGVRMVALVTVAAIVVGGLAAFGSPVKRIERGWDTFKGGYAADSTTGSRLISGLGSNRYDFYRVALDESLHHPFAGIGADNFQQEYLAHGRSEETPHYPHSVELRTLADTGLLGALLALIGLGAALLAAAQALRRGDPLARYVAAAALAGFFYWVVHGSFDWFWEFAGLGAPAFALLGLACALAPARTATVPAPAEAGSSPVRQRLALALGALAALAAAASLAAPWFSQLELQSAARIWTRAPGTAYARLRDAADLNPLSDEAYLLAGSIALRYGELARADRQFSLALGRNPSDAYATLELGAIASARGRRATALELLERAERLEPREPLVKEALGAVRAGRRVSIEELNRSILIKAQQFG